MIDQSGDGVDGRGSGRRARLLFAGAMAILWGGFAWSYYQAPHLVASDFDHLWRAARIFWAGADPYAATGPGRQNDWPWPLFYPATALTILGPFAALPLDQARVLFTGVSVCALAWAATRAGWSRTPLFASCALMHAVIRGQWAPLMTAAFFWSAAGVVLGAKPTIGAAVWLARPTRVATWSGIALVVATTIVFPGWVVAWLQTARSATHFRPPIASLGGPLLLLALLRWRRPEARLLALIACAPVTLVPYDTLPLFAIPATFRESAVLALLSWISVVVLVVLRPDAPSEPVARLAHYLDGSGPIFVALLYLPCLVMVLRRPNDGSVRPGVERLLRRWRVPVAVAGRSIAGRE